MSNKGAGLPLLRARLGLGQRPPWPRCSRIAPGFLHRMPWVVLIQSHRHERLLTPGTFLGSLGQQERVKHSSCSCWALGLEGLRQVPRHGPPQCSSPSGTRQEASLRLGTEQGQRFLPALRRCPEQGPGGEQHAQLLGGGGTPGGGTCWREGEGWRVSAGLRVLWAEPSGQGWLSASHLQLGES